MENKYLTKIATNVNMGRAQRIANGVKNYFGNVTGRTLTAKETKLKNVLDFKKNRETISGLRADVDRAEKAKSTAQIGTAVGAGVTAVGAGYLYKRKRDAQKAETMRYYQSILKSAAINPATRDAARQLGHDIVQGTGRLFGRLGSRTVKTFQSATSRPQRLYGRGLGVPHGEENKFAKAGPDEQIHTLRKLRTAAGGVGPTDRELRNVTLANKRSQINARMAIGATGVATVLGGALYGAKKDAKAQQQYY
jgi:hypothetical protein